MCGQWAGSQGGKLLLAFCADNLPLITSPPTFTALFLNKQTRGSHITPEITFTCSLSWWFRAS
jgi:hypothetical protein